MKPYIAIPILVAVVHRAWSRKSLTPVGLVVATLTAIAHALHPWSAPLFLLAVFFLAGTRVTKVKHDVKSRLTLSATGSHGGEGPRTHVQVLANSVVATVLIVLHTWVLANGKNVNPTSSTEKCFSRRHTAVDLLAVGIVANYAAVAADTFSSELGILSKSKPRLITSLSLRVVPPGTNGGVTGTGLLAGLLGAFTIALTSAILVPFCVEAGDVSSTLPERFTWILAVTVWGGLGSVLDSVLGGLLQASVVDKRTGKIVEGAGGQKVLIHPSSVKSGGTADASGLSVHSSNGVHLRGVEATESKRTTGVAVHEDEAGHESRKVESGLDILDNNAVNVLMAFLMSVGAMGVASFIWDVSIWDIHFV